MLHLIFRRGRRTGVFVLAVVLGLLVAGLLASRVQAQTAPVSFAYLVNSDTIATETITPGNGVVRGVLGFRGQPRVEWEQQRQPLQLTLQVFAPGAPAGAPPAQRFVFRPRGDSMVVEQGTGATPTTQVVASKAGAVPLMGQSVLHVALMTQYARAEGRTTLPVFMTQGGRTMDATVAFMGDSSIFTVAGLPIHAHWRDGVPQVVSVPSQNLRAVRAAQVLAPPPSAPVKPDYNAPTGAPYTAESVVVPTARGYTLAGTLTKPIGVAKMPVVVTISGSGQQERDSRVGAVAPGYAIFRDIADTLGRRGVAVLRYDDRGAGESGGGNTLANATSADFANDVRSVVAYLRTRADIDASRIVLAGHSEGGFIAPMVAASDPQLRAVALLAGTAYSGRRVLEFQNENAIRQSPGLTDRQRDSLRRTVPRALDSLAANNAWMGYFMRTDPLVALRQVKQPVLVLQGNTDQQVTPEQADTIATALRAGGNRSVTLRRFAATNHLFLADSSGAPGGYRLLKDMRVRRDVLGALADWVAQVVK